MSRFMGFACALLLLILGSGGNSAWAHPGAGIAVDDSGDVYFTDTGKGIWKLDVKAGEAALIAGNMAHWMAFDSAGKFSQSRRSFARGWFERATPEGARPAIIASPEFPAVMGRDGNLHYVNTLTPPGRLVRRAPDGAEATLAEIIQNPQAAEPAKSYVTGITCAPDGSFYLVEAAAQHEYVAIHRVEADGKKTVIARDFVPAELRAVERSAVAPSSLPQGAPIPKISRSYCRGLCVGDDGVIHVAANAAGAVLRIDTDKKITIELRAEAPWLPTDVAIRGGEIYVLEYDHTGEDRLFWTPRVRKIAKDGHVTTLVTIKRD